MMIISEKHTQIWRSTLQTWGQILYLPGHWLASRDMSPPAYADSALRRGKKKKLAGKWMPHNLSEQWFWCLLRRITDASSRVLTRSHSFSPWLFQLGTGLAFLPLRSTVWSYGLLVVGALVKTGETEQFCCWSCTDFGSCSVSFNACSLPWSSGYTALVLGDFVGVHNSGAMRQRSSVWNMTIWFG
jgi:hypothetical protein